MTKKYLNSKIDVISSDKKAKIFLSFSPLLLKLIFTNKISNFVNLKKYNGIYLITNNESVPIENNLKEIKDCSFISYHIVSLAYRFKRQKINKNYSNYYTLPFSENLDLSIRYIISTVQLIIKAYKLQDHNIEIYLNRFNDKYINIFLKRYFIRKYNIRLHFVSFGKVIKPNQKIYFSYKSCNLFSIFSILKLIPFRAKKIPLKLYKKEILEVNSFKKVKKAYRINKKESFLQNKVFSIDFYDLFKFGLNKYKSILYLSIKFIINIQRLEFNDIYKITKYNLIFDYIQLVLNILFIKNLSIFLKKINIKYLICSYRSFTYEWLIYKVCKVSNIKSIVSDFSLGYPLKNIYKKDISLTTRPDLLIVNSLFRKDQYLLANKDYINSGNKLEIINCSCMQIENARLNSKNYHNLEKPSDRLTISIFDNNYGENLAIRSKYTKDLVESLNDFQENLYCLVHSKARYFYLEKELSKRKIDFCKAVKGDFSLDINSDLIISIGFQGAAIKAAFAFNKPIIFFSSDKNYFDKINFLKDKALNKKLKTIFKKLTVRNQEIKLILSSGNNKDLHLNNLLFLTNKFLDLIGITNKTVSISSYLKKL